MENYDFSGWATRANIRCSDGRTILKDAFKHNDGQKVPLVWNHKHDDPNEVLGHALLENREEGVYAYGKFNDTDSGKTAKLLVRHGDINAMSIYANQLRQDDRANVRHGNIREVSLVLAGANPGAFIESVIMHGEASEEEAWIYTGEEIEIRHADEENKEEKTVADTNEKTQVENEEKTVGDVWEGILKKTTEEEQNVIYALIGQALEGEDEDADEEDEEDNEDMKHNVFDMDTNQDDTLMHADIVNNAIADGKRFATLKDSIMAHAAENNITDIQELFPNEHDLHMPPEWYKERASQ